MKGLSFLVVVFMVVVAGCATHQIIVDVGIPVLSHRLGLHMAQQDMELADKVVAEMDKLVISKNPEEAVVLFSLVLAEQLEIADDPYLEEDLTLIIKYIVLPEWCDDYWPTIKIICAEFTAGVNKAKEEAG